MGSNGGVRNADLCSNGGVRSGVLLWIAVVG